jgi:hypothetical protein
MFSKVLSSRKILSLCTRRATTKATTNNSNTNAYPLSSVVVGSNFGILCHQNQHQHRIATPVLFSSSSRPFVSVTLPLFEKHTMKVPTMGDSITEVSHHHSVIVVAVIVGTPFLHKILFVPFSHQSHTQTRHPPHVVTF